jgi:hypothetical protein
MRMREIISEAMAQTMLHRNTTIGTVKALARNSKSKAARFVIHDGKLHASDAEEFTHYDIWPLQKGLRGWVYHDGDAFTYKAVGIYDMHPADDPLLRAFERAGIAREITENLNENIELATLVKNPSTSQIKNLLAKYHPYGLRGVHADNTFWVWNAYDTTHHYVARKLGLDRPDEFVIRTNEYGTEVSDHTGNGALAVNERFVKMVMRLDEPYWVGKVVPEALRHE